MKIKCLYASTEKSSDALYLSGISIPDDFLVLVIGRRRIAVVSQLEYSRVKRHSRFSEVYEMSALKAKLASSSKLQKRTIGIPEIIASFFRSTKATSLLIPYSFPSGLLSEVQSLKLPIEIQKEPFIAERALKTEDEVNYIKASNNAISYGFRAAKSALASAKIKNKRMYLDGSVLTSEYLRNLIDKAVFERGAVAQSTIVACGNQACDPHQIGYGPLKPNELIIVDIFPRSRKSHYFGDMTRTFLKGSANDAQKAIVQSVQKAQKNALSKIKDRVKASRVHSAVIASFEGDGFYTGRDESTDSYYGFIHSTGHGVGLDIHEAPSVSKSGNSLKKGHVITVEPGLYYPNIGACRIEDVVLVTDTGFEKLSSFPYQWQIQ